MTAEPVNNTGSSLGEWLTCTCCGTGVINTPEQNVSFSESPYPHDTGFAMCLECGGDPKAGDARKRMGWAMCTFYDARIPIVEKNLSGPNLEKWHRMSYVQKCSIIKGFVEKGIMI